MPTSPYCTLYPLNPVDTYPQIMSDGRAFTLYQPNQDLNCMLMQSLNITDSRDYRHKVIAAAGGEQHAQLKCLEEKYTTMNQLRGTELKYLADLAINN